MWVGLVQIIKDQHRTKILSKNELLLPECVQLSLQSFSDLGVELKYWFSLHLELVDI